MVWPVTTHPGPLQPWVLAGVVCLESAGLGDVLPCLPFSAVCVPPCPYTWLLGFFFSFLFTLSTPTFDVTQEVGIKAEDTVRSCERNCSPAGVFSFGVAEAPRPPVTGANGVSRSLSHLRTCVLSCRVSKKTEVVARGWGWTGAVVWEIGTQRTVGRRFHQETPGLVASDFSGRQPG